MSKTDTSERGLERLICTALTGHPCDPPKAGSVAEPEVGYGGLGWAGGNPHDYDREYCVDLAQLTFFLRATQPEAAESLALDEDGPTRRKITDAAFEMVDDLIGTSNDFARSVVRGSEQRLRAGD